MLARLRHYRRIRAATLMAGYLAAWLGLVVTPCLAVAAPLTGQTHHAMPASDDCARMPPCPHCPQAQSDCVSLQAADCDDLPAFLPDNSKPGMALAPPPADYTLSWSATLAAVPAPAPADIPPYPSPPFTELFCSHNE